MTSFLDLAAARYSVRSFCQKTVEPGKIASLLSAARLAPTACNNQPQRIKVIDYPNGLALVDQCSPCRFDAPIVFLICYDKTACWTHPENKELHSGQIDASIVTTHIMMAAQDIGLGSCWVMKFDAAKASELFALPKNFVPTAMLPVGYPAGDAAPSERHSSRLTAAKITF